MLRISIHGSNPGPSFQYVPEPDSDHDPTFSLIRMIRIRSRIRIRFLLLTKLLTLHSSPWASMPPLRAATALNGSISSLQSSWILTLILIRLPKMMRIWIRKNAYYTCKVKKHGQLQELSGKKNVLPCLYSVLSCSSRACLTALHTCPTFSCTSPSCNTRDEVMRPKRH